MTVAKREGLDLVQGEKQGKEKATKDKIRLCIKPRLVRGGCAKFKCGGSMAKNKRHMTVKRKDHKKKAKKAKKGSDEALPVSKSEAKQAEKREEGKCDLLIGTGRQRRLGYHRGEMTGIKPYTVSHSTPNAEVAYW